MKWIRLQIVHKAARLRLCELHRATRSFASREECRKQKQKSFRRKAMIFILVIDAL